jgi:hypothetical protein
MLFNFVSLIHILTGQISPKLAHHFNGKLDIDCRKESIYICPAFNQVFNFCEEAAKKTPKVNSG